METMVELIIKMFVILVGIVRRSVLLPSCKPPARDWLLSAGDRRRMATTTCFSVLGPSCCSSYSSCCRSIGCNLQTSVIPARGIQCSWRHRVATTYADLLCLEHKKPQQKPRPEFPCTKAGTLRLGERQCSHTHER